MERKSPKSFFAHLCSNEKKRLLSHKVQKVGGASPKKRVIVLTLALLMVIALCSVFVAAADNYGGIIDDGTCGKNLTWVLYDSGTLIISGEGDMNSYYSTSSPWNYAYKIITNVVIEDGVTSIGDRAFFNYASLTSIDISDSVTRIKEGAFSGCSSLTSIKIPNSVTIIEGYAFFNCYNMKSITIPASVTRIGTSAFFQCQRLESVYFYGDAPKVDTSTYQPAFYGVPYNCIMYYIKGKKGWINPWYEHTTATFISGSDGNHPLGTHSYVEKVNSKYLKTEATCCSKAIYKAIYYKSCSICGEKSSDTFENDAFDAKNHVGETYIKNKKDATCATEGYTGDTYCSSCNAILQKGAAIAKTPHTPVSEWSSDGSYHWHKCQSCGAVTEKQAHSGGSATCTKNAVCSVCGTAYGTLGKHLHTEIRNKADATCTANGYTGDTYCTDCNSKVSDGKAIPAVAHKLTKVAAKAATHTVNGNIEYYTCSVCGKLFADANATREIAKADTVVKGEHSYGAYKSDAANHWKECSCGDITGKAAHSFGEWSVTKEATTTEDGSKERSCSACGYSEKAIIPALGENVSEPDDVSDKSDASETSEPDDVSNTSNTYDASEVSEPNDVSDTSNASKVSKPNDIYDTSNASEASKLFGDTSHMFLWIIFLLVFTVIIGSIIIHARKKHAD